MSFKLKIMGMGVVFSLWVGLIWGQSAANKEFHHPQQFLKQVEGKKDAGKQIYAKFCQLCHALNPAVNVGAPRIGVKADWQARLEGGLDAMLKRIDEGVNAMPSRGGCFECSDEQLKAAVDYMLPK